LEFLEDLVSFGPRVTNTENCFDAGEYIYNEFVEMGLETRYVEWERYSYFGNVIEATHKGYDESSDEIFLVCAHYDSVRNSPGADDDGSGVAAVMTAAKLMSQYIYRYSIRFVAFDGEEQGLLGSKSYVQDAIANNDTIVAVINLDMIGYAPDEEDEKKVQLFENDESKWLADYTIDINNQYNQFIDLEILRDGYSGGSDHLSFWSAGYDAIFFSEYKWNDYYHSSADVISKMNLNYAVKNSKLMIATLAELAQLTSYIPPEKPEKPSGPINGKNNVEYKYSSSTTDADGDTIYYLFDWGDGTNDTWIGPYESGETVHAFHIWKRDGNYNIRVKARDESGLESEWSESLLVSMPKNRILLNDLITTLMDIYPRLKKIIT
jgi:hypothetical protein